MTERGLTQVFDGYDNVFTVSGANGKDEGLEFISSLDDRAKAKFQRYLEYLRDGHRVKSPENMRHLSSNDPAGQGAQVHELKVHIGGGLRLYVIRWHGKWYITHGARKPKDKLVPQQISRAYEIFHADI